jgi:hypothetical protein
MAATVLDLERLIALSEELLAAPDWARLPLNLEEIQHALVVLQRPKVVEALPPERVQYAQALVSIMSERMARLGEEAAPR